MSFTLQIENIDNLALGLGLGEVLGLRDVSYQTCQRYITRKFQTSC